MSLQTYEEARPWANAIKKQVVSGAMPPWHASPEFAGVFSNERTLTESERQTLVDWVDHGAPRGISSTNAGLAEHPIHDGWTEQIPDLVIEIPKPFLIKDEIEDLYQRFPVKITREQLPHPRWIRAIEYRPDSDVVHHFAATNLMGITPGGGPIVFPEGSGQEFQPDQTIVIEMHYHKEAGPGTAVWDQSSLGLSFWPPGTRIDYPVLVESLVNKDFVIPPGDPNYVAESKFVFEQDSVILSILPHMHLRGKSALYVAKYPDSTSERLLFVPRYDFNWQHGYHFKEPHFMPAGTELLFQVTFDNSLENDFNPDPTATVRWGDQTTDEMMHGGMKYARKAPAGVIVEH